MRFLTLFIVLFTINPLASAASITVTWSGKVPSIGCAEKQISNQTDLRVLKSQCRNDINTIKKSNKKGKTIVEFNI
jgi:hypothetical protein